MSALPAPWGRLARAWRTARLFRMRDLIRPGRTMLLYRASRHTLLPLPRLAHLADLVESAPAGAIVECGTGQGGSAGVLAVAGGQRTVWLFDSWAGCPEPGPHDVDRDGRPGRGGQFRAELAAARRFILDDLRVPAARVLFLQGWFEHTIPATKHEIGPIGLLHLDGDWYESTRTCLTHLYDLVVPGGTVAIDAYAFWAGCRKAVDEFLAQRGLDVSLLRRFDRSAVWFTKP